MHSMLSELRAHYEKTAGRILANGDPCQHCKINVDDVLRAHYLLCDYFLKEGESIAQVGPSDENLLVSAISRQASGYDGKIKWTT
jgi:hypothetical protein